jgi:hypothetical protein
VAAFFVLFEVLAAGLLGETFFPAMFTHLLHSDESILCDRWRKSDRAEHTPLCRSSPVSV